MTYLLVKLLSKQPIHELLHWLFRPLIICLTSQLSKTRGGSPPRHKMVAKCEKGCWIEAAENGSDYLPEVLKDPICGPDVTEQIIRNITKIIMAIFGQNMPQYYLNNWFNGLIDLFPLRIFIIKSRFHYFRHQLLDCW